MSQSSDRQRTILAMVQAQAARDQAFRARLIASTRQTLKEEGLDLPAEVEVRVLENTSTVQYVVISKDFHLHDRIEEEAPGMVRSLGRLPAGFELRILRDSESLRFIVLPVAGAGPAAELSDADLASVSGGVWDYEATSQSTTAVTTAEAAAEAVTVTVEAQDVATTTTAAAEAEVVAVVAAVLI